MEEKDYRLVVIGDTQVGFIGLTANRNSGGFESHLQSEPHRSIWDSSNSCTHYQWKGEIFRESAFEADD